jgi:hypothetical protein
MAREARVYQQWERRNAKEEGAENIWPLIVLPL